MNGVTVKVTPFFYAIGNSYGIAKATAPRRENVPMAHSFLRPWVVQKQDRSFRVHILMV